MDKRTITNGLDSDSSFSKETSILLQLMDKSGLSASILAFIGCILWCSTMVLYFVNDLIGEPLAQDWIFYSAAGANFLSALLILFFAHFLYHHQKNHVFSGFFLSLYIGCLFRAIARLLDGLNEVLYSLHPEDKLLGKVMYLLSDINHFLGFIGISVFMLFLLYNELKSSYKVISIISFILSLGMSITYITLFILDLGIISFVHFQLTRFLSFFISLSMAIFFSLLIADSFKLKKAIAIAPEA